MLITGYLSRSRRSNSITFTACSNSQEFLAARGFALFEVFSSQRVDELARVISPRSRDANGNSLDEIIEIRERK